MIGYKQPEHLYNLKIGWSGVIVGVAAFVIMFTSNGLFEQNAYATDYTLNQTDCESLGAIWIQGTGIARCSVVAGLTILSTDTVTVPANVVVEVENPWNLDPAMLNQGTLLIEDDGALQVNSGSRVVNESNIDIAPGGQLSINGGSLTNSANGVIDINDGTSNANVSDLSIDAGGELSNGGSINIHQSGVFLIYNGSVINDGEISIESAGTLTIFDNGYMTNNGGITNNGNFGKYCGGGFVQNTPDGPYPYDITTCPLVYIEKAVVDRKGTEVLTGDPTSKTSITFTFSASEGVQPYTFECELDHTGFTPCVSGVTFNRLSKGDHTFQVKVTDANSQTATTEEFNWIIVKGKK